jgi:hypothetical protein
MSQTVKLRRSSNGGNRPTNSQLQLGELAINTTDGKLYFAKSGSLAASIEEVLTTNTQNTGSLNLSGSFNLIGTESITGSTKIIGSLSVTGDTSLTSLVISGADATANISAFIPSSSVYNNASFNTPNRVAAGVRFNWGEENWTIGAARGLTTDIDGLIFSRNGDRNLLLDENGGLHLTGSLKVTGSLLLNGEVVGTGKLNSTEFYNFTSSATSTIASSSYAQTASYVLNPIVVSGVTRTSVVSSPAATWSFNHQMGQKYPSIQVFNNDGYIVMPSEIKAVDENNLNVYFSQPQTGVVSVTLGGAGTAGSSGSSGSSGTAGSSGTSGRDGLGGYSQTYTASVTWSVPHNLDMDYPVLTVWGTDRKVVIPTEVHSIDTNNIKVYFSQSIAGTISVIKIL